MMQGSYTKPMKQILNGASRSQGLVEFVLSLPLLLAMLFAIIDFALLFSAWLLIQNMARQAVRFAVTGAYDPAHCTAGCLTDADKDQAHLLTIHDQANDYRAGLLINNSATILQPGFLQVTVCSSRDTNGDGNPDFLTIYGLTATSTYGNCLPTEDAGGPDDIVAVSVDFNNPFITPFLNQVWPMVHLASHDQGKNETFRVSRQLTNQTGPQLPSTTPTFTPTASTTLTATPSATFTVTPTPTNTGTSTPTPSITATPDCSQYYISATVLRTWSTGLPDIRFNLTSGSLQDTYVQLMTLDWASYKNAMPSQTGDHTSYDSVVISSVNYPNSPYTWVLVGPPTQVMLYAGYTVPIDFDFQDFDPLWPGDAYTQSLGLTVDLANGCTVTVNAGPTPTATNTPTPTDTFTITDTPTITNTSTITDTPTITNTPTNTPVPSSTPTATATAACFDIFSSNISDLGFGEFSLTATNLNPVPVHLTKTVISWTNSYAGQMLFSEWFNGTWIYFGPAVNSPFTVNLVTPITLAANSVGQFDGYFLNVTGPLYGIVNVTLTFDFTCNVGGGFNQPTPTASNTMIPSNTPTITNTPTRTYTPTYTYTPTDTPIPPTSTPTYLSPTPTQTPTRTDTPTPAPPTSTATDTPTMTPTPSDTVCFDC